MLSFLPRPLVGIITLLLLTINLLIAALLAFIGFTLHLIPFKPWQKLCAHYILFIPTYWFKTNDCIKRFTCKTQFEIHYPEGLSLKEFYLVTSNHQSWSDILILFSAFDLRIPMLKFFWKKQLRWLPLVGALCSLYGFPIMYRHTKEELKKHPEWKGRDFENTRKACEKLRQLPGSLTVFAEGTRFTPQKQARQQSPFRHLLKPKAGGLALGLQCLGPLVNTLLDVTIIYPIGQQSFWDYCCGTAKKITININAIPITSDLRGNYENDPAYRAHFQRFVNKLWEDKDKSLNESQLHEKNLQ